MKVKIDFANSLLREGESLLSDFWFMWDERAVNEWTDPEVFHLLLESLNSIRLCIGFSGFVCSDKLRFKRFLSSLEKANAIDLGLYSRQYNCMTRNPLDLDELLSSS